MKFLLKWGASLILADFYTIFAVAITRLQLLCENLDC